LRDQPGGQLRERRWPRAGSQTEDRARDLARGDVRHADHRDLGDRRMLGDQVLQLARADVLALADDDVLAAAGEPPAAGVVQRAEIPGPEPAVRRERIAAVEVAEEALGAARDDLALAPGADVGAVLVDESDLVRADRPSVAVDAALGWIVRAGGRH